MYSWETVQAHISPGKQWYLRVSNISNVRLWDKLIIKTFDSYISIKLFHINSHHILYISAILDEAP